MKRLMLSAMHSGSGKTVVTCGLLRAFQRRGLSVESYKCGPDYIDPMFHRQVLDLPGRNLDLFLQGKEGVKRTLAGQRAELALIEGAMGYYDGVNGTHEASAWQVAETAGLPAVLVEHCFMDDAGDWARLNTDEMGAADAIGIANYLKSAGYVID